MSDDIPYVLAIDNGTQSVRALVFDLDGQLVAKSKISIDPYFSTDSKSGGLELSSAFSIVKAHGGTISVHSTLGRGTRMTVYLPATPRPEVNKM